MQFKITFFPPSNFWVYEFEALFWVAQGEKNCKHEQWRAVREWHICKWSWRNSEKIWFAYPFQCRTIQKLWPASPFQRRTVLSLKLTIFWQKQDGCCLTISLIEFTDFDFKGRTVYVYNELGDSLGAPFALTKEDDDDDDGKMQNHRTFSSWTSNTSGSLAWDNRLRRGPNCNFEQKKNKSRRVIVSQLYKYKPSELCKSFRSTVLMSELGRLSGLESSEQHIS